MSGSGASRFARRLAARLPSASLTRPRNGKLYAWMNTHAVGKRVLNLGSGVGRFDAQLSPGLRMIKLDIDPSTAGVDVVADAHHLPFRSASLDVVYSIAVLEHVRQPWVVAGEIARVLKPGGHVALELPFLNIIHDQHDYFRFTDKGIRSLFDESRFDVVLDQVGSGGGSFASAFLLYYLAQFVPTSLGKKVWVHSMQYAFSLLRYLDILIDRSPDLRVTANSFAFIGRRR
jgi:ubiquinone/menaquinone biosynthesis C-methylase UbiE